MLWTSQKGKVLWEDNTGTVGSASLGTTAVTTGGSASVKGTEAQLIAATTFDAYLITIVITGYGSAATLSRGCVDIKIGPSSGQIIIPNLLMGQCGLNTGTSPKGKSWTFPLYIPAGSRLSAQAAGDRVSVNVRVALFLFGGNGVPPFRVGSRVTTYGIGTVPAATAITPGASGAEGAWTQITAATTEDHFAFLPSFQINDGSTTTGQTSVDVGIGSATEEQIGGPYWFALDTNARGDGPWPDFPIFADVPSGTRLVMRASASTALDAGYEGAIHAVS